MSILHKTIKELNVTRAERMVTGDKIRELKLDYVRPWKSMKRPTLGRNRRVSREEMVPFG